ncbi:MAG TPA: flagellar hook-basal body complex protein FliE [Acidiphilium sp.]
MTGIIAPVLDPASAVAAYKHTAASAGTGFAEVLTHTIGAAIDQGKTAEIAARNGLQGQGDLSQVVTSVAEAQLALQTTVAIRDRLIQSCQSIMNMPI